MERIDELNEQINTLDKSSSKALMVYIISAFLAILTPFALKEYSNELNSSRTSKKVNETDNSTLVDSSISKIYKYEYK